MTKRRRHDRHDPAKKGITGVQLFVSGATVTMNEYRGHTNLGRLVVPSSHDKSTVIHGWSWAMDNGAFAGFHYEAFMRMLNKFPVNDACRFVVAPDVVADADATSVLFEKWEDILHSRSYPVAYVAQDGALVQDIPWDSFECLFIGGSTEFKLAAFPFIREAKRRDKWVHVGRVNSMKRMRWAFDSGADSIDGSSFSRFPARWIPWALDYLAAINAHGKQYMLY